MRLEILDERRYGTLNVRRSAAAAAMNPGTAFFQPSVNQALVEGPRHG
jgi:hypothetical protein